MSQIIVNEEASTPSTPGSGKWKLYAKADGWYALDDAGVEVKVAIPSIGLESGQGSTITISSGSITPTHKFHLVSGEGAAADDLTTIVTTNAVVGDILILMATSSTMPITCVDSTGLAMPANFTLNSVRDTITFVYRGSSEWAQLCSSDNV